MRLPLALLVLVPLCSLLPLTVSCGGAPAMPPTTTPPSSSITPPPPAPSASAAAAAPDFSGAWLGTLHAGPQSLRIQLRIDLSKTPPDPPGCFLDSLDQHATGIPCSEITVKDRSLTIGVSAVHGTLVGDLSADGSTLTATWTQGGPGLPLVLTRQASAIEAPKATLDPALPPVGIADLQGVLDKDLAAALASGDLAPGTDAGATIGVVAHGTHRIFAYGTTKPDSVFEIGSITKTFTGLILAQMVEQKKARLDEPVRALLPPGTVTAPASGAEITLLDLSAQRSGLPRMPDNFKPADESNPYVDYDKKLLYAFLAGHGVAMPDKPVFGYSNLGVGLLGQALCERAGTTYETLVRKQVTGPLGMRDTVVSIPPTLRARFAAGHDGHGKPAHAWDQNALAGAGAIRSTAADMLTYLEAQLHPDHLPAAVRTTQEGKTLAAAITASHALQGEAMTGTHIALNWFRVDSTGSFWHNGATGGHSAFAWFNPDQDIALVVLFNTSIGDRTFADDLGTHIAQRLLGKPAISMAPLPPIGP
jgi:serine-type D-Ala-D-Ala carboxypeptidase/endopeptidase